MSRSIFEILSDAGLVPHLEGEKLKLAGPRAAITPELMKRVKRHREEILAALKAPRAEEIPLTTEPDSLTEEQEEGLSIAINQAGAPGFAFVLGEDGGRSAEYELRGFTSRDADITAAVDFLLALYEPTGASRAEQISNLLREEAKKQTAQEPTT